ncbi:MAG: cohesin domain-containing protein [Minisyncoccia bacterium]
MKSFRLLFSVAAALGLLSLALPAFAASVSLTPSSVSVAPGQTFSVTIAANGQGTNIVTLKSEVSYPANLVEPVSFSLAPSWVALTQPGYDQMSGGTVIKTGGYPSGFTGAMTFGTLTFKALAAGTANLSLTDSSAYSGSGAATLSSAGAAITIAAPALAPKPQPPAPKPAPVKSKPAPAPTVATSTPTTTPAVATSTPTTTPALAAAVAPAAPATPAAAGPGMLWLWILIAAIVIIVLVWLAYRFSRRA